MLPQAGGCLSLIIESLELERTFKGHLVPEFQFDLKKKGPEHS